MKDSTNDRFRRQYGVLHRIEALGDGVSSRQIKRRVASGQWIVVSPGVLRHAAFPITAEQQILAAVLAAGRGAVASHQAAAYLWGLLEWPEAGSRAAVSVPRSSNPRPHGFDVHRVGDLDWARVRALQPGAPGTRLPKTQPSEIGRDRSVRVQLVAVAPAGGRPGPTPPPGDQPDPESNSRTTLTSVGWRW